MTNALGFPLQHFRLSTTYCLQKQACHKDTINLYDFMHWCIKPKCAEKKCSYVQLVADEPQKPAWFVSHWWGEPVRDFVRCLNEHARVRALSSHTAYWVCAYLSC